MIIQIINKGDGMNIIEDYSECKINGLNYVREIKSEDGKYIGYLLIDNNNKPVKDVYNYLEYMKNKHGCSRNTLKRFVYDILYLYDFLLINELDVELFDYSAMKGFINAYLKNINPSFRTRDCIERSMLKKIPLLPDYKCTNVSRLKTELAGGLSDTSISRIVSFVRDYFIFLHSEMKRDINLNNLFNYTEEKTCNEEVLLGHLPIVYKGYSARGILKACNINLAKVNKIKPISEECIFTRQEIQLFFNEVESISSPAYQLLFYLLDNTGMRVSEALAFKFYGISIGNAGFDLKTMKSQLVLENEKDDLWQANVLIDPNDPPDLRVKNNKERSIPIIDSTGRLKSLVINAIHYRDYIMKKKRKSHNYLFINRNGERLKQGRTLQHFYEIFTKAGMQKRIGTGQLTIHSLRHTYASEYVSKLKARNCDVELELLSSILGHSSAKTTKSTYVHFFKEEILELLKRMEKSEKQP